MVIRTKYIQYSEKKKTELVCLCVVISLCPQDPDPPEIKPRNFSPERKSRKNEMTNLSQGTIHISYKKDGFCLDARKARPSTYKFRKQEICVIGDPRGHTRGFLVFRFSAKLVDLGKLPICRLIYLFVHIRIVLLLFGFVYLLHVSGKFKIKGLSHSAG